MIPDTIIKILIIGGMILGTCCGIYAYSKVNIFRNKTTEQMKWLHEIATSQPVDGNFSLSCGDGYGLWIARITFGNPEFEGFVITTIDGGQEQNFTAQQAIESLVKKVKEEIKKGNLREI